MFVHMFTTAFVRPFRRRLVLGVVSAVRVDSTGEQVFVFGAFPLVVGRFWAVELCEPNRHVLVLLGLFVVYKCSGCLGEHVFCDNSHTGNVRFASCVSRETC